MSMFNLLPQEEKRVIYEQYSFRKLQLIFVFVIAAGVMSIVLLFPSFFLAQTKRMEIQGEIDFRRASLARKDTEDLNVAITRAKSEIVLLEKTVGIQFSVYDLFNKVIARKGDGIKITGLLYGKKKEGNEIVVNGVAKDREALLAFAQDVGREQAFSHISLPVSNFAKNKDIDFSFTITGNF